MGRGQSLTYTNRLQIEAWSRAGIRPAEMARLLGCHRCTVYRELKRGQYSRLNGNTWEYEKSYSADIGQEKYKAGLEVRGAPLKIGKDRAFAEFVEYKISKEKYSPAAVLGEIERKGLVFDTKITAQTLYRYIDKGVFLTVTNKSLPVKGKRTGQYRKVKPRPAMPPRGESIEKRPSIINSRATFGHWEMDCVCGKAGTTAALLVFTERLTRFELVFKIPDKTTGSVVKTLDRLERKFGPRFNTVFQSITVDNGAEFQDVNGMERSARKPGQRRTRFYYCHPYSSYERGSNENQNKMIRRHFPKGFDFTKTTQRQVNKVQKWLNEYPRELFDWYSSADLFEAYLNSCA